MNMFKLEKCGFNKDNIISYGNMFLIGNGHLGYRGTLEEYSKNEMVGLNVCGLYDRYKKLWRESVNMPNPFFVKLTSGGYEYSVLTNNPINHKVILDIKRAVFYRVTEYDDLIVKSERFISCNEDNLLLMKYEILPKKNKKISVQMGLDTDIFEINGPHFKKSTIKYSSKRATFKGTTNERKTVFESVKYIFPKVEYSFENGIYSFDLDLVSGKSVILYSYSKISEDGKNTIPKYKARDYKTLKTEHEKTFENKFENSYVEIKGNDRCQFALNYSIYHLLILGNDKYKTSIPARGVSGSVYKGAIFWDTEIFMVPFFTLTDRKVARKLLEYRIETLNGALAKAKEYGYDGAFYAWESQDSGKEGCSKYNITDPDTGKPVRTYFNEKQIHISADIVYAIEQYMNISGDYSLLDDGALNVMKEVSKFFMSYSKEEGGKYHLLDVIGPDEYHERIDDNAFTSYMAKYAIKATLKYLKEEDEFKKELKDFLNRFYVPSIENGLIEQFKGYYKKEDVSLETVRTRIKNPKEYWGGKKGVATPTRIIKQADVIALLVLLHDEFTYDELKKNFDFYYKYTEHGSSLSSSMYSIIASKIGYCDIAYSMFLKSAEIDLGTDQKMYAGGIYIGGTHPASNGGSYLSIVFGMAGLELTDKGYSLNPHLPKDIKGLKFKFNYQNKTIYVDIFANNKYEVREEFLK